uniref:Uncharacterized protein n=1 Tax=Magallana gigas TaxID=29159 RepID=K1RUT9_MAGGI
MTPGRFPKNKHIRVVAPKWAKLCIGMKVLVILAALCLSAVCGIPHYGGYPGSHYGSYNYGYPQNYYHSQYYNGYPSYGTYHYGGYPYGNNYNSYYNFGSRFRRGGY